MTSLARPFSELVFGVSFVAPDFGVFDYGLLATKLSSKYPKLSTQAPIATQADFGPQVLMPQLPRGWLESEDGHRLVQIQQDRLVFNWKRVDRIGEYPHFDPLLQDFIDAWESYRSVVSEYGGSVELQRFECSYINNIAPDFIAAVNGPLFKFESPGWNDFLPRPALRQLHYTFNFDQNDLKLRISARPAVELAAQREVIALQLDAVSTNVKRGMTSWFRAAHEIIKSGFEDILTKDTLTLWREVEG